MDKNDLILSWDCNRDEILAFIKKKVRKTNEIDDILQEVFIKYWEKNYKIIDKTKVRQWLLSVTRFTIADYFREKKDKTINPYHLENQNDNPTDNISDESRKLLPIIYDLPPKYRNILLLSEIYGIPHKVISEQLNLTLSCVKTRVIRGRKLLIDKMQECCTFSHDKYGNILSCLEKKGYLECVKRFEKSDIKLPLSVSSSDNK